MHIFNIKYFSLLTSLNRYYISIIYGTCVRDRSPQLTWRLGKQNSFPKRSLRLCSCSPPETQKKKYNYYGTMYRSKKKRIPKIFLLYISIKRREKSGKSTIRMNVGVGYTKWTSSVAYSLSTGARSSTSTTTSSTASPRVCRQNNNMSLSSRWWSTSALVWTRSSGGASIGWTQVRGDI